MTVAQKSPKRDGAAEYAAQGRRSNLYLKAVAAAGFGIVPFNERLTEKLRYAVVKGTRVLVEVERPATPKERSEFFKHPAVSCPRFEGRLYFARVRVLRNDFSNDHGYCETHGPASKKSAEKCPECGAEFFEKE